MKVTMENGSVKDQLYERLIRVFGNGFPVLFSFSGGKDSLVIAKALLDLAKSKKFDPAKLHVMFVDEEAIFPCVENVVRDWRTKFIMAGANFIWLCLEFKHFNCFNSLVNDESFICWDRDNRDVWVREIPEFAVTSHHLFRPGDSYQEFGYRITGVIQIVGIRASE